jgi:hypothetical protein
MNRSVILLLPRERFADGESAELIVLPERRMDGGGFFRNGTTSWSHGHPPSAVQCGRLDHVSRNARTASADIGVMRVPGVAIPLTVASCNARS